MDKEQLWFSSYQFNSDVQSQLDTSEVSWKYQMAATEYAHNGSYQKALEARAMEQPGRSFRPVSAEDSLEFVVHYRPVDALEYLANRAKDYQIVIINEAHHAAKHRNFTRKLLEQLSEQGFKHLGLETLGDEDVEFNKRGYPLISSGYYSREAQFGNMIRAALEIGFQVFPYEYTGEGSGDPRERGQAERIKAYLEKYPGEKVIIHCGYAHVNKGRYPPWGKAMAGRVMELTGLEPLTINQEKYSEQFSKAYLNGVRKLDLPFKKPIVFVDQGGNSYGRSENVDVYVWHENTTFTQGRPDWIFDGEFKPVEIRWEDDLGEVLVQASKKVESQDAVPIDMVCVANGSNSVYLSLPAGSFLIRIFNHEVLIEKELFVE